MQREAFVGTFKEWWKQPFSADMDVPHWWLFFGLLICVSLLWRFSLATIQEITSA